MADHVDYLKVFKQMRGYFGSENILIGGSYVYSKELDIEWNQKDIDIFVLIPRMETWALVNILKQVFDVVMTFDADFRIDGEKAMKNQQEYYKIEGQWKRVICYKNSMMYDLILVDNDAYDLINNNTGSSISKLYYKISFNDEKPLQLSIWSKESKTYIKNGMCTLEYDKCTEAYASKIENICKKIGLEIDGRGSRAVYTKPRGNQEGSIFY